MYIKFKKRNESFIVNHPPSLSPWLQHCFMPGNGARGRLLRYHDDASPHPLAEAVLCQVGHGGGTGLWQTSVRVLLQSFTAPVQSVLWTLQIYRTWIIHRPNQSLLLPGRECTAMVSPCLPHTYEYCYEWP